MLGEEDGHGVRADLFLARVASNTPLFGLPSRNELGLRVFVLRDEDRRLELEARRHDQAETGIVRGC